MSGPIKHALLAKSREAALSAVQTYNNPLVRFKSETFIVLMTIAWTYLLHAYYAREEIDYRYLENDPNSKRRFRHTPQGGYKWWELGACLKASKCPLDPHTANNLTFLLGLRNEIEHHRPPHLDDHMSGRYLACALNYEYWLTALFGDRHSLSEMVAMALQFRDIKPSDTSKVAKLPSNVSQYIERFEGGMTEAEYNDPRFAYRLIFTRKVVSKKGQADRAIEFMKPGDPGAEDVTAENVLIRDTEKPKHRRKAVLQTAHDAGYPSFGGHQHTQLWKSLDAKNPALGFGTYVEGEWFWYDTWVTEVLRHCQGH